MSLSQGCPTSSSEGTLSPEQQRAIEVALLREMISAIPDQDAYVGKQMLLKLLDARGPEGVRQLANKIHHAAAHKLSPELDAIEKTSLRSVSLRVMDRRVFMDCLRWGILGTGFTITSSVALGEQLFNLFQETAPEPAKPNSQTPLTSTRQWIERNIATPLGFAIGVNWMYDAYAKWQGMKLEHVARAIDRMTLMQEALGHGYKSR